MKTNIELVSRREKKLFLKCLFISHIYNTFKIQQNLLNLQVRKEIYRHITTKTCYMTRGGLDFFSVCVCIYSIWFLNILHIYLIK
jgi:hypothetical protein